ncbi:MAG: endonuclease/exonuclease/phosphatase family protein [Burkholderiales bacterium]
MNAACRWLAAAVLPLVASCVMLTEHPRALVAEPAGVAVRTLDCADAARAARGATADARRDGALDGSAIRIVTWNIHKQADGGWDRDLARFAGDADVVLLQEVALQGALPDILHAAGLSWVMASSFIYRDADIGVLSAARVAPVAACTLRAKEPLIQLPKSAVVTWYRLPATGRTLAVANLHSINFALTLGAYEEQLASLADALAAHDGPIVLGGDLNTWTDARADAVRAIATRLRLVEIPLADDLRTRFLGQQVDHLLVRGVDVVSTHVIAVTSSDHNPVAAVLRLRLP